MKTPRRFPSNSLWLIVLYCLATVTYLAWATSPIRARPQLAGTIPEIPTTLTRTATPTKTPKATATPKVTKTPTPTDPASTASTTPTSTELAPETSTPRPGATKTPTDPASTASITPTNTKPSTETPTATTTPRPGATETSTDPASTASITPTNTKPSTETPTATTTPTVATLALALTKTDFLFGDQDQNNLVSPGDKLLYAITMINIGKAPAQQVRLEDTLDPNISLIRGTVQTDKGSVSQGNNTDDTQVLINIGTLAAGERAIISLQVSVKAQVNDTQVQNQAIATFVDEVDKPGGQMVLLSDDPDTPDRLDSTITPLNGNQPRPPRKLFLPFVAH